jgi:hypothetical protein
MSIHSLSPASHVPIVRAVLSGLLSAGKVLHFVYDGGDLVPVSTVEEALDAIFAVDEATVRFRDKTWVEIVLYNDPVEAIHDFSMSLQPVIDPILADFS